MTDERLNQILQQALIPEIKDSEVLIKKKRKVRVMKRRTWKKTVAVAAACAALITVVVCTGNQPFSSMIKKDKIDNLAGEMKNTFTFSVRAEAAGKKALEKGKEIPVFISADDGANQSSSWSSCEPDGTHTKPGGKTWEISYCHQISLICEGDNIDTITYSINTGFFLVQQHGGTNIILDGEKADIISEREEGEEVVIKPSDEGYDDYLGEHYSSYTVSADNQEEEMTTFSVAGRSMISDSDYHLMFGHNTKESIADRQAHINRTLREMTSVKNKVLNNVIITAKISYKDGSTQEAKIQPGVVCKTYREIGKADAGTKDADKLVSVPTYKLF